MSCDDLDLYFDGELPADQRAAFEAHLVGCPRCQAGLHELMQLTIASLPAAEAAAAPAKVVPLLRRRALWVSWRYTCCIRRGGHEPRHEELSRTIREAK